MVKLLIIADDITGALDTGVQFVNYGVTPIFLVQKSVVFEKYADQTVEVLVLDVETRHMNAKEAYDIVYNLVKDAVNAGVQYIYKKTDSGLRGNVGSELSATLRASGKKFLAFVPAFPKMNRVTTGGIHYIDGVPLRRSIYGKDPFDPVASSYIPDLFADFGVKVKVFEKADEYDTNATEETIGIFDAHTDQDMDRIVRYLKQKGQLSVMAGCAGAAAVLNRVAGFEWRFRVRPSLDKPLLIICGSVSPVSKAQVEYAKNHGFGWTTLSADRQLKETYLLSQEGKDWFAGLCRECASSEHYIIETDTVNLLGDGPMEAAKVRERGQQIAAALGHIVGRLLESGVEKTLMIIGGDTLLGFFEANDCGSIQIVCELSDGMVLSRMNIQGKVFWLISKSGAFGGRELLVSLAQQQQIRREMQIEQKSI